MAVRSGWPLRGLDRPLFDDPQAMSFKTDQRMMGVGEEHHVLHAEIGEERRPLAHRRGRYVSAE